MSIAYSLYYIFISQNFIYADINILGAIQSLGIPALVTF